jgi:ubiquinol-cytochrome c reductase iron-sulfur subunit
MRLALWLALVGALAATVAASSHASPALVAWLAATTAFAFAFAAGLEARRLKAPDDLREPRQTSHATAPTELPSDVTRRTVFGRLWVFALGAVAVLGIVPVVALGRRGGRRGPIWNAGLRLVTADGVPLRPTDLSVGAIETVFPQGRVGAPEAATLLLRLEDDVVRAAPERADWTPHGNVAYSKICTHAGCPVAIYRHQDYQLYCPCHQSVFDVLDAARPISGPATRALPQLALDVDGEGYLIARSDFDAPVGPDEWRRTV